MKKMWILFLGLSLVSVGCGSSEDGAIGPSGNLGGSGTILNHSTVSCPNDRPTMVNFTACQMGGMFIPRSGSTPDLCRITFSQSFSTSGLGSGLAPIVNPSAPCGNGAASTGFQLKAGDRLSFSGVSGAWGEAVYEEKDGFLGIDYWSLDEDSCSTVPASGSSTGLFASDGREAFFVGAGLSNHVVKNNGQLKLGFNVPTAVQHKACSESLDVTITVTRCEDNTGRSYTCP